MSWRQPAASPVPGWALATSAGAPVLLIGGWTLAAALQPGGFDQIAGTISDLAGEPAAHRQVMTAALVGVGLCYLGTAWGLRPAALPGRAAVGIAGVATMAVAAFPLTAVGTPAAHTATAGVAFVALTVWPALARRQGRDVPPVLRTTASLVATGVLAAALGWFVLELAADSGRVGLAERVAAGAQSLWPLAVVVGCRRWSRSRRQG